MIKFLTKGIIRDRSRSLFPVLVVTLAVAMIIFFQGFFTGVMNSMFLDSAVVSTGHVKVMTRGYKEESQLLPNDLALLGTDQLVNELGRIIRIFSGRHESHLVGFWMSLIKMARPRRRALSLP